MMRDENMENTSVNENDKVSSLACYRNCLAEQRIKDADTISFCKKKCGHAGNRLIRLQK